MGKAITGGNGVVRIAYQGMEGSFSEYASRVFAEAEGLSRVELMPAVNARGVVRAVQAGEATYGVVGVANSTSGIIGETADTMDGVRHVPVASVTLPIIIVLFGLEGDMLGGIKAVHSHPASLYQCERRVKRILPNADLLATPTSAVAAARLAAGELPEGSAVLCSPRAGRIHNLVPLLCPANDSEHNETAFMVFRKPHRSET